jgi:hypothetical protein
VPAPTRAPTRKSALRRVGVAAILLVVGAVALEGLVSLTMVVQDARARTVVPRENFRQAQYDSTIGWVGLPNLAFKDNFGPGLSLHTNAEGMRIHHPVTPALAPGKRRIICSGDSFTYGSGVSDSDTFCAQLERDMPGFETLNMAQRGFGMDQMYLWYQRDGVRYPHQIQVFAFIWNDLERMALTSFFGYAKPIIKLRDGKLAVENVPVPQWGPRATRLSLAAGALSGSRLLQLIQSRLHITTDQKYRRAEAQEWDVATAIFRRLDALNRERGSQLVLVYLPTLEDVNTTGLDPRRAMLAKFAAEAHIPVVDPVPAIRAIPPDSVQWLFITPNALPVDGSGGHYTALGHRWIADRIAERLRTLPAASGTITLGPTALAVPAPRLAH